MYIVEFYENAAGESELWDFLEELRAKAERDDYLARKEAEA